jgi:hypothetical protein
MFLKGTAFRPYANAQESARLKPLREPFSSLQELCRSLFSPCGSSFLPNAEVFRSTIRLYLTDLRSVGLNAPGDYRT